MVRYAPCVKGKISGCAGEGTYMKTQVKVCHRQHLFVMRNAGAPGNFSVDFTRVFSNENYPDENLPGSFHKKRRNRTLCAYYAFSCKRASTQAISPTELKDLLLDHSF